MSVIDKLREAKDELKHKLKGEHDVSASAEEQAKKAEELAERAKDAAREKAEQGKSAAGDKARDLKGKIGEKLNEAKEHFRKP